MRRMLRSIADRVSQLTRRRAPAPAQPAPTAKPASPAEPGSTARPASTAKPARAPAPTVTARPATRHGRSLVYAPQLDGQADPGEIVWTWVPYEEDPSQGKDRPVLVVGRDGDHLHGLMLSSNSRRDGEQDWFALGPGDWDRDHRPSWVRLDRVLTVAEHGIRREGAVLDQARFNKIATQLRSRYGWL